MELAFRSNLCHTEVNDDDDDDDDEFDSSKMMLISSVLHNRIDPF